MKHKLSHNYNKFITE